MNSKKIKHFSRRKKKSITPKYTRIIITSHHTDDILLPVKKLNNYGHNVSFTFTNKFWKDNNNVALTKREMNQIKANIFDKGKLRPTLIITDNENLNKELVKIKKICTVNLLKSAVKNAKQDYFTTLRKVKSETNLASVKVDYNEYPRNIVKVKDFIKELPGFCIFFTAFGFYQKQYNFPQIIKVFETFLDKQEKIFGNCIMLAVGGNFSNHKYFEEKYFKEFYYKVQQTSVKNNVLILGSISTQQKRALLRLSYALLYFNNSETPDYDVKLALSVGTPIIGTNLGFLRHVFKHEPRLGYSLSPNINAIVSSMYDITSPINYKNASKYSRLFFLKHHTKFAKELLDIKMEERKQKGAYKRRERLIKKQNCFSLNNCFDKS